MMPVGSFAPTPYRRAHLDGAFDAIVIGSGAGSLTAAALLSRHSGRRVLVLERHYTAGGMTHTFRRPGVEWDVGVHYVGQGAEVRRIFDHLTAGRLQWAAMPDVYDRFRIADREYVYPTGVEALRDTLKRSFPADTKAVDRYLDVVRRTARHMGLFFAEKALPPLIGHALGRALRWPFLRTGGRTTRDVIQQWTRNPELLGVLTGQWGDYGLPPGESSFGAHAAITAHYFDGGAYPVGGAGAIIEAMAPTIEAAGGQIVVNAEVESIRIEGNRAVGVRMADGRELRSPIIISGAGARLTYNRLLPVEHPALQRVRTALHRIPPSTAHLCLYVSLNGTAEDLGLTGSNLWVFPTPDHDLNMKRFADNPDGDFPAVYISFPSAKDATFTSRFPGRSTIDLITFVPYEMFGTWKDTPWKKRGEAYISLKTRLTTKLLEVLYRHVPSAQGRVDSTELSTPLTTRHFNNAPHGEIYGLAHSPERFLARELGPRTPFEHLYLTGQDAATCGVMGAVAGGILAASVVLRRNMFGVVLKQ